jgi:hypothetical protein
MLLAQQRGAIDAVGGPPGNSNGGPPMRFWRNNVKVTARIAATRPRTHPAAALTTGPLTPAIVTSTN